MAGLSFRGALNRTDRWFFDPQPVDALVLSRITFGAALFFAYLVRLPEFLMLYGPHGLAGAQWIHPYRPGGQVLDGLIPTLEASLPGISEPMISAAYTLLLLSALCFTLGLRTRSAGIALLLLHMFFQRLRLPYSFWGWSVLIQPLLFYVILSQAGRFSSLDRWLRRRRPASNAETDESWTASAWPLRLLQIHTCTMYLVAGLNRLDDPAWIDGQTIWFAMTRTEYSRWVFDWQAMKPLFEVGNYATWLLEPVAPVLLWVKGIGPWIAYALIAMHVGLEVLTNVGWWNFMMIATLTAFIPRSHLRAVTRLLPGGPKAAD